MDEPQWSPPEGPRIGGATLSTRQVTEAIPLPQGARVTGVSLAVTRRRESGGVIDDAVRLVTNGVTSSTPRAAATEWDSDESTETYGCATVLWGLPLTRDELVAPTFGIMLSAKLAGSGSGSGKLAYVNAVTVTVHYCP